MLRSAFPDATPDQVTAALKASPTLVTDPKNGLSFPRLDCAHAMLVMDGSLLVDDFE
jgi:hypothetical protein